MSAHRHGLCSPSEHRTHRRGFLRTSLLTPLALSGLASGVAIGGDVPAAEALKKKQRHVLFLWLAGGASQFEMWDPKPGRETGGPFRSIATAVPGYRIGELMPKTAAMMDRIAVVRSLNTQFSEHEQAADLISIGRPKEAAIEYPEIGVVLGRELALRESELPDYISVFTATEGRRRPAPGFFGGRHAPVLLEKSLRPENIVRPAGVSEASHQDREALRSLLSTQFAQQRAGADLVSGYNQAFARVRGLMRADHLFDLDREPAAMRDRYGRSPFGEQCLLARRLIEAGVPVVKLARGFWDSHHDNFESHRELVPDFDHVFTALLTDLEERGLLESTLVMVLSEFGRTPVINKDVGRDHYAAAWSVALAGAGVRGGVIHGRTDDDGKTVADGQVDASDLAATLYRAAGLDLATEYKFGLRPVPIVKEGAKPIEAVLS